MYLSSKDKEGIWQVIGGVGLVGAVLLGNYLGDHIEWKENKSQTTNSNYSIVSEYGPRATGYGAAVVQRNIIKQQIAKHSETGLVEKVNGAKQ